MAQQKKIVLAFSGGLDTSYCVPYLKEQYQAEIHTVLVNTGGFDQQELDDIEQHAYSLGSHTHQTLERTEDYYSKVIRYLIFGNILKNNTYPLSVSSERVFQAVAIAKYALEVGADAIAHGSTGAGNDQVRFDLVFNVIAPDLDIITPIRDQQLTREEEVAFLQDHDVDMDWSQAKYSVNKGLWGTSVGGAETLTSDQPLPDEAYPSPLKKEEPQTLKLTFTEGEPTAINGESYGSIELIQKLDALASQYAIGRDIHVGDTIIGIKGRVGFEAAAAMLIIKAHEQLEKHVLTKWQLHWKDQLANWYGMMLHEGQYLDPVMRNIEAFLDDTQPVVNGTVSIRLLPYRFEIEGITSDNDLMNAKFGDYGEMNNAWSGEDVKGFAKILSNQIKIHQSVNNNSND
ncbi:argininosuccinate synthase [Fodinibius salsisoli]|uniref:argininosuccinate synthase n=1 Tax=Fodinibius salsisoli TaxID=2820877 RepID=A0ABT3PSR0_9BACT|nr:argininosuccinate synthase domain-containing protein [Fodinibius salsisoli]MCW9708891.1 argininosuccinate synthase [Fodinibius salsisoli]